MLKMKNKEKIKYYNNLEKAMAILGKLSNNPKILLNRKLLDGVEGLDEELQELWSSDKKKEIPKENYIYYVDLMKQTKDLEKLTNNKTVITKLQTVYNKLEENKNILL